MRIGSLPGSIVLLVATAAVAVTCPPGALAACDLAQGARRAVVEVIDGETLTLDDGSEVRLVGAMAPRAPFGDRDTAWPHEREAMLALEDLVKGRTVELRSAGEERDRYGRRMAQVFVSSGDKVVWVQDALIRAGHARAYRLAGFFSDQHEGCFQALLAAERAAQTVKAGLWTSAAYEVRRASAVADLVRIAGQFAVVEGEVVSVAARGKRVYLNFGSDWRRDFTVVVPPGVLRANAAAIDTLKALERMRVRVRGWISLRNGPAIEVGSMAEIETIPADDR